jgi:pimeloyl-ACP methyl ester carboxylesterase/DNA-binding CsgD family transcriptional regulator
MDAPPVQYVTTSGGYSIAYAVSGEGRPVVWMPHLFSHIEVYWTQDTFIRAWLEALASRFQLIQYDGYGQGMSARGLPKDLDLSDAMRDLEAVAERLQLERFVLVAVCWSGHVAVRFAAENPHRVEALVLEACPIRGTDYEMTVFDQLASRDWDRFIRTIAAMGQPHDVSRSIARLNQSVTPEDHLALARAWNASDISSLLHELRTPTLVLHPRDYFGLPVEAAMELASKIPNARMVLTDGATAPGDAAQSVKAIEDFLAGLPPTDQVSVRAAKEVANILSQREVEVLRLIAAGKSNQGIADELVISPNTVRRHVSNIFDKTGAANRVEAAAYATRRGLTGSPLE